jgi:hypothetical protein
MDDRRAVARIYADTAELGQGIANRVAASFRGYPQASLSVPKPQHIRAGRAGGLPFDSLTTDLFVGCLPASLVCYGSCFAARAAFDAGIDFGHRVENMLDEQIFVDDLEGLPPGQRYLKNGWNSDPSWSWNKALQMATLVHSAGRHLVFITKCFTTMTDAQADAFARMGIELRVSLSALDSEAQLAHRIDAGAAYRRAGGVAVPQVFTAVFRDARLNTRQLRIAEHLVGLDFPVAENSLRFTPGSPMLELVDTASCGRVADTGDLWSGRLYASLLPYPALTAVAPGYAGLPGGFHSAHEQSLAPGLWHESIPTHAEVMAGEQPKPRQCGVPMHWR